jgi:hypothetical protein
MPKFVRSQGHFEEASRGLLLQAISMLQPPLKLIDLVAIVTDAAHLIAKVLNVIALHDWMSDSFPTFLNLLDGWDFCPYSF